MSKLYWLIPVLLFFAQLIFTINSETQIRYEELADSVRNVFWLENRLVYDGVSGSVGWYATLLSVYKIFGFDIHSAKYVRLALFLISMICLGLLLHRYKVKQPYIPYLVLGLSPSLLYYNTLQTPHGVDLIYVPICLYLVTHTKTALQILGWIAVMWAWLSYPSFIFYLPGLVIAYLWLVKPKLKQMLLSIVSFLTPLAAILLFIKNRALLIHDENLNSGLFRGAGSFDISAENFANSISGFLKDIFIRGSSYHFEVEMGEFSLIFPIVSVLTVFIMVKKQVKYVSLVLLLLIGVLLFSSLTSDPSGAPGIRRFTPVLAYFYVLFIFAWNMAKKKIAIASLSLFLIHHFIVYPINLMHLQDPSPSKEPIWFTKEETPKKSLEYLVDIVKKEDLKLVCSDEAQKPMYCRYAEVYAAVAGSCVWNNLSCNQILGYDFTTGSMIPLSTKLWEDYYFEH